MSELFEALRKAQRDADAQRHRNGERREGNPDGNGETPRVALSVADSPTESNHASRRGRFDWLRRRFGAVGQNGNGSSPSLLMGPRTKSGLGEQFRVLRTRVEIAGRGTFMITSALDQEGKSLCAANLAIALSMSIGAGVILVDADLRQPTIDHAFKIPRSPGLADCLLGEAVWGDCLQPTEYDGLKVLPAGRGSSMSTELLGSERMLMLIAELKTHFPQHHILVDAPPLLLTADPLVLARHMDHVLLVVRAGRTPRDAVLKAIEILGTDRFLGIVFNDVTQDAAQYYYGRYHYGSISPSR